MAIILAEARHFTALRGVIHDFLRPGSCAHPNSYYALKRPLIRERAAEVISGEVADLIAGFDGSPSGSILE